MLLHLQRTSRTPCLYVTSTATPFQSSRLLCFHVVPPAARIQNSKAPSFHIATSVRLSYSRAPLLYIAAPAAYLTLRCSAFSEPTGLQVFVTTPTAFLHSSIPPQYFTSPHLQLASEASELHTSIHLRSFGAPPDLQASMSLQS